MKALRFLLFPLLFGVKLLAAPIYEPFNYPAETNLIGRVNPFENISWLQAGPDTTNQPQIIAGNLAYPGRPPAVGNSVVLGGNGTSARFSFSNIHTVRTNSLFYSFLMQVTDLTGMSPTGIFWAAFNNTQGTQSGTPSAVAGRLLTRGLTNENGEVTSYQIGVSKNSGTIADFQFATNVLTTNDVIFVVVSYDYTGDQARLWVNPEASSFGSTTAPEPSAVSTAGQAFGNIRSFVLFNRNAAQPRRVVVDQLLIGPEWADVAPSSNDMAVVIAPIDQRVASGSEVLFESLAHRTQSYRWQHDGTDLAGETSPRLVLTNAQASHAGVYSVILSNAAGLVTNSANLQVITGPLPGLSTLWSIAPGVQPFITSGDLQRTMAHYDRSNRLYIVSRTNNGANLTVAGAGLTINVLDGETGAFLHTLATTNAAGEDVITAASGTIILGAIGVADDGAIYASNIGDTGGGGLPQFKLYRWANGDPHTLPQLVFGPSALALQTVSLRWGDVLAVRGSGTGTEIVVTDDEGLYGVVFTPTDDSLSTFDYLYPGVVFQFFTQNLGRGSVGRTLDFLDGNQIVQMRRNRPYGRPASLLISEYEFTTRTSVTVSNLNVFTSRTGPVGGGENRLAAILFSFDPSAPDTIGLFDIDDLAKPILLDQASFPVPHQNNPNSYGQVIVSGDRVFALNANNGLVALAITAPGELGPALTIRLMGESVELSWTAGATGFALERASTITANAWAPVTEPVTQENGTNTVTIPLGGGAEFFRLKR